MKAQENEGLEILHVHLTKWYFTRIDVLLLSMIDDITIPTGSEVAAIVPNSEDGKFGTRYIVLHRSGQLNRNGNEDLDAISVSHRFYIPPFCVDCSFQMDVKFGIQNE